MFNSIPDTSLATGLTDRGIKAAYHSKRDSLQKKTGEVYHLSWEEPDPIREKPPAKKKSMEQITTAGESQSVC